MDDKHAARSDMREVLPEAMNYSVTEILRDGTALLIRAIRPDDKERLLQHFQGLSQQSVYYRFFGFKRSLNDSDLSRLTEIDFVNHVGLVASDSGHPERFLGVGRFIRTEVRSPAEVAFAVLDEYQGHGIGTLLLRHLARIAQRSGIRQFVANVLGSNHQMLEVFTNSGFSIHNSHEGGVVHIVLDISK